MMGMDRHALLMGMGWVGLEHGLHLLEQESNEGLAGGHEA